MVLGSGELGTEPVTDKTKDDSMLIGEALNNSISSFHADLIFEQLVKDYKTAEHIYGPRLLRHMTGLDETYLENNVNIPEFQRELKKRIEHRILRMRQEKLIDKMNQITDKGIELASHVLFMEELDKLNVLGLGEKDMKKPSSAGDKTDVKEYQRGDPYRNMNIRKTLKSAVVHRHDNIAVSDLRINKKQSKGKIYLIFALDSSGSMRGDKIAACKKAGIALSFKATNEKDSVGLLAFSQEIVKEVRPTLDFTHLLREITTIRAKSQTNIAKTLRKAIDMFPNINVTKHVVLISDAIPTSGKNPEKETLEAVSIARSAGITISVVGIKLGKARRLAQKIVEIGQGRLYEVKDPEHIDIMILEDYYAL